MISVFKNTYLLINIAPYQLKVKRKTEFWRKKPAVLFGPAGKKTGGRKSDGAGKGNRVRPWRSCAGAPRQRP